ncbi:MAG TPA: TonB-dependent receptor [Rhodanobacter sp.]
MLLAPLFQTALAATGTAEAASTGPDKTVAAAGASKNSNATALPAVMVTAEKRETALQSTPIAVTAVSAAEIQHRGLNTLRDLTGTVPGLVAPGSISNMQFLYIRGIGTGDPGFYPAVAVYVDDIYRPRPFGVGTFSLPDIERIEVLRGPQGTLYGQNSSAGAVKFISRDPDDTTVAKVAAGVGNKGFGEADVYLAGAVKPGVLSLGVAAASRRTDGYTYNATLHREVDATALDQVRVKARLTPNDSTTAVLSIDYGRDRSDNASYIPLGYPGASPRTTFASVSPTLSRTDQGVDLHIDHQIDDHLSFKSTTAYRKFVDDPSPWDEDGTPQPVDGWTQYIHQHQSSQEFQLNGDYDRLTFAAGAVYFHERLLFDRFTQSTGQYSEASSDLETTSYAVYAQANYRVTDELSVTLGGRLGRDDQDFDDTAYKNNAAGDRLAQVYSVNGLSHGWRGFTPKYEVDYQWNPGLFSYLSVTKGEKIGGYNRSATTATIASLPLDPERVTTYEFGTKSRFLEGRAQANVAIFYNDFADYQAAVVNPVINGQFITGSVTVNAAHARTYGLEFDGEVKLTRNWDLKGSASYLETRFASFANPTGAANTNYAGNELPNAPKWTLGADTVYRLPLPISGALTLSANARYIASMYSDITNSPYTQVKPQTYVGASIDYAPENSRWSYSLKASNLLDKTYAVNLKYRPGIEDEAAYNPPRQLTLWVRYEL